jgi:hypothetical protein
MGYPCPVCGYSGLTRPPEDYYICPCCGTEFGYDDFAENSDDRARRWIELRQQWLSRDAGWFSSAIPPPDGWNPYTQLVRANLAVRFGAQSSTSAHLTVSLPGFIEVRVA